MAINTINSNDPYEKTKLTLNDLQGNGKEKLADIPDKELQQLKQQAIEAEDYDIAKMIKQEQTERAERAKETGEDVKDEDDLQELEYQTKREEEWKSIQEKKVQSKEEAMAKVDNLITQLNDGEDLQEDEDSQELDGQSRREETWKTVNSEEMPKTDNEQNESNVENKLNEISDEEIMGTLNAITDIEKWRWRENYHMRKKMGDYLTKEDIPGIRKWMKEHPENGIVDKETFYTKYIDEISELVKASVRDFSGALVGNTKSLEIIIGRLNFIAKNMKGAGMGESEQFGKLKKIYTYFNNEKNAIERHNSYDLNIHNVRYRRRA